MSNEVLYCKCRQNGDIAEWLTWVDWMCPLNYTFQNTCTKSIYFITVNYLQLSVVRSQFFGLALWLHIWMVHSSFSFRSFFWMLQKKKTKKQFQMKCKCTMWRYAMHKVWLILTSELWFDLTFLHLNSKVIWILLKSEKKWEENNMRRMNEQHWIKCHHNK